MINSSGLVRRRCRRAAPLVCLVGLIWLALSACSPRFPPGGVAMVDGQYVYVSKLCHRTIGYVRSSVTEPKATFTVRLSKDLHGNTVAPLFHSQGDYTA